MPVERSIGDFTIHRDHPHNPPPTLTLYASLPCTHIVIVINAVTTREQLQDSVRHHHQWGADCDGERRDLHLHHGQCVGFLVRGLRFQAWAIRPVLLYDHSAASHHDIPSHHNSTDQHAVPRHPVPAFERFARGGSAAGVQRGDWLHLLHV